MKLLILGATGKTGRELVTQALAAGHQVTAFVRNPAKLPQHEHLTPFVGDAESASQIQAAAAGQDAVISALGHTSTAKSAPLTAAATALIETLPDGTKYISLTGYGVPDPKDPQTPLTGRLMNGLIRSLPGGMYADGAQHVELLRTSTLDYTVIRAPVLTQGPATGAYELGYFSLAATESIPRADVAAAMLTCLTDPKWSRQTPMIRRRRSTVTARV